MERSRLSGEESQPTQTDPGPNDNFSRMRKFSQDAARFVRKMASNVPSSPTWSPSPATGTGETDYGHSQAAPLPGFALPPGLPSPPGLPHHPILRPPPGFAPLPPRGTVFGSQHSPPARRPGGIHLETCHSLSKTRVYDDTLRCDKCGGWSDFGWFYRCCHDTETRLYESIRDGNTEHFDDLGEMFSQQLKRPERGPAARSDKLSLLEELTLEQIGSLSAPQLAQLLQQRGHANQQAITDQFGFLGLTNCERPFLKNESQECKQTLCPACGKGMLGEEVSFLDLDGILKGDIPPSVALGYGFRKHGRPIHDANIVRKIGLRKAPKKKCQGSHTAQSAGEKTVERDGSNTRDEDETGVTTCAEAPLTPSNTLLNMADSSEDLLEFYTDGSSVEASQNFAQDKAPGEE